MNTRDYFNEIVVPSIDSALSEPSSKQRAFSAATSTYQLVDYISQEMSKSKNAVIKEIESKCPPFKAVHTLAAASKHTKVDDPPSA